MTASETSAWRAGPQQELGSSGMSRSPKTAPQTGSWHGSMHADPIYASDGPLGQLPARITSFPESASSPASFISSSVAGALPESQHHWGTGRVFLGKASLSASPPLTQAQTNFTECTHRALRLTKHFSLMLCPLPFTVSHRYPSFPHCISEKAKGPRNVTTHQLCDSGTLLNFSRLNFLIWKTVIKIMVFISWHCCED